MINNNFARLTIAATLGGLIAVMLTSLVAFGSLRAMPDQMQIRVEVVSPIGEEGGGDEFPGQRRGGGTHKDQAPPLPTE